jgi:hypothetical protein
MTAGGADDHPRAMPPAREIVLPNAKTAAALTERIVASAAVALGPSFAVRGLSAPFGAASVSDAPASAVAAHAVVEMARGSSRGRRPRSSSPASAIEGWRRPARCRPARWSGWRRPRCTPPASSAAASRS